MDYYSDKKSPALMPAESHQEVYIAQANFSLLLQTELYSNDSVKAENNLFLRVHLILP